MQHIQIGKVTYTRFFIRIAFFNRLCDDMDGAIIKLKKFCIDKGKNILILEADQTGILSIVQNK